MKTHSTIFAATTLAAGLVMAAPSQAATELQVQRVQAGPACQLSLPTTATSVRGRATGFRNEGTTPATVICEFASSSGDMTKAEMYVTSLDSVERNVSCTGVNGYNLGADLNMTAYSTKTLGTHSTEGVVADFVWDASDFGGTAGDNFPNSGFFSVTCNLPAKTAINVYGVYFQLEIGT